MAKDDPYWKLKPKSATPAEEICSCKQEHPLILCYAISENPLRCFNCNLEVQPEKWQPPASLVNDIASWCQFYTCFYGLWLDSGEFEEWARKNLSDPENPVNRRGYKTCKKISTVRPCYYWWFQDTGNGFVPINQCPKCGLNLIDKYGRLVCEPCSIVVAN